MSIVVRAHVAQVLDTELNRIVFATTLVCGERPFEILLD
jgi:hypothetical protein